ncbi:MAG: vitamin K epoxide reductase family protein, partial [Candidatus Spechtbacterales bacterium]
MEQPLYVLIVALALTGLFVAIYIFRKKHSQRPLVCPMRANCDVVIHSQFSTFLGIPLELLGMLYYGGLAALYMVALTVVAPSLINPLIVLGLAASAAAFVFS